MSVETRINAQALKEQRTLEEQEDRLEREFNTPTPAKELPRLTQTALVFVLGRVADINYWTVENLTGQELVVDLEKMPKSCVRADVLDAVRGVFDKHDVPARISYNFGGNYYLTLELTLPRKTWITDLAKILELQPQSLKGQEQPAQPRTRR